MRIPPDLMLAIGLVAGYISGSAVVASLWAHGWPQRHRLALYSVGALGMFGTGLLAWFN